MKAFVGIAARALALMLIWSSVGLGINLISSKGIPWVYERPSALTIRDVRVPLVDEKAALKFLDDPDTTFVDTRKTEDFAEAHVKGAVSLPAEQKEDRYELVQPLLPEENRLILYCYGPECEDAERVAGFLVQLGYRNLLIMSPGFPQWKKVGYPMESRSAGETSRASHDAARGADRGKDARPADSTSRQEDAQGK